MKDKKTVKILLLIIIVVGASIFGFIHAKSLGVGLFEEKVHNASITSESDIIAMGGSFYNNVCKLENDVTLYQSFGLATRENPFVGVFDGNGHTITISDNAQNSLFGYIGEGGVVKNLHIVVVSTEFTEKTAAIVALENEGTIINCKVTVKYVGVKASGNYGAVVSTNRGVIKNVVVSSSFESKSTDNQTRRTIMGGICAYNYGEIDSCISEVSYKGYPETIKSNIFSGNAVNNSIGAVCGVNNGTVKNSVSVISESTYVSDNKNKEITFVTDNNRKDVFSEENLFENLGFNEDLWIFINGEFSLIQGE